ncbi:MAG: hypothetical protein HYZ51_03110, partial [Candidatus Doudnabacteria bacterium]|nr:hypothetical protein [Candidatus Doudnabacteria bacterium]
MYVINQMIMYAMGLGLLGLIDLLVFFAISRIFRSRMAKLSAGIDHMENSVFFLLIPFLTFLLCCPLLYVCLYGGDTPAYEKADANILFYSIPVLPVIGMILAAKTRRVQVMLFLFLTSIFLLEIGTGITPTGKHDGTDITFVFFHGIFFLLSVFIAAMGFIWFLVRKGFGLQEDNFENSRKLKKIKAIIIALACSAIAYPWYLNSKNYCFEQGRYFSDAEYIEAAIKDSAGEMKIGRSEEAAKKFHIENPACCSVNRASLH